MEINIVKVRHEGSCNYCDKSIMRADGMGLEYPYDKVVEVKGYGIKTRFCFECFRQLASFKVPGRQ